MKREHPDGDNSDSPLPKFMRTMMNNAQGMNPATLQALQANAQAAAQRAAASTPPKSSSRPETPRSRTPPLNDTNLPPHLAAHIQQQHKLATAAIAAQQAETRKTPTKESTSPPSNNQPSTGSPSKATPQAQIAALGELGARLFPGANMSAKLNVNGKHLSNALSSF